MSPKATYSTGEFQVLADAEAEEVYRLTLYVAGSSARSIRAIHPPGRCQIPTAQARAARAARAAAWRRFRSCDDDSC